MAPSDSQHPEIGAEVEEEEDEEGEEEVDETKQNKHRGHSRAAAAGLGQPRHGRVWGRRGSEQGPLRKTEVE